MGNSTSKDGSHSSGRGPQRRLDDPNEHETTPIAQQSSDRGVITIYGPGGTSSRRSSRHEIPFLHLGRDRTNSDAQTTQRPRETRQEKEARRAERERQARLKERERSMREEIVDGGFLVTLGTYTGAEDFSKAVVRQLQIERRLAPFWKGLNDHSDAWTEYQLVSAVRGLTIPAADEIPPEAFRAASTTPAQESLAVPTSGRPRSSSAQVSSSQPSTLSTSAPVVSPFFRGRSKTLASLTGASKVAPPDLTPQEIQLPHDPNVNGLPIEAYLYREPSECPICFLYYPPYLNKTRCCDQLICSECFVQIKRPDPHPPEHEQPGEARRPEEEAEQLVSEVAACPFCVAPEFGITYEPPPFRRGLTYPNQNFANLRSATSSQTSFQSGERRRTTSISASSPEVVTTDKVRPDWAKKLADARAHALRRSAAATALHNAAYVLGNQESLFRGGYGRRRRSIFSDSPSGSGTGTPGEGNDTDLFPGRNSSRRNRVDDLEDLMMMEAIRLSLAAEEERKRKEDKEKSKEDKKKVKDAKKEAKQLEKLAKRGGGSSSSLHKVHSNDSTSTWASTSMARSSSNLGSQPAIPEEEIQGKGKAPALGTSPGLLDANRPRSELTATNMTANPQRHLEESRANIQSASTPIPMPRRHHPRTLSNTSSIASSLVDSTPASLRADSPSPSAFEGLHSTQDETLYYSGTPPTGTPNLEPMLNFRSLAAMIDIETKSGRNDHLEHALDTGLLVQAEEDLKEPSPTASPAASITFEGVGRSRGDSGESSTIADVNHTTHVHDNKAGPDVQVLGQYHETAQ